MFEVSLAATNESAPTTQPEPISASSTISTRAMSPPALLKLLLCVLVLVESPAVVGEQIHVQPCVFA